MNTPHLIVSNLASVDGRLTIAPEVLLLFGDARWSAVAGTDTDAYHRILTTYQPQALLEGSGSFILDGQVSDPLPAVEGDPAALYADYLPAAIVEQPGRRWMTVVDGGGRGRWIYKEFPGEDWAGFYLLILVSRATPAEYLAYLRREEIPYLVYGAERPVDLPEALVKMKARLGVECLVSTAGGKLNGALLRRGLVDEIELEFFPAVIGGRGTPALFDAPPLGPDESPTRLERLDCQALANGSVRLHYRVVKEAA